jgi:chromatin remodeling complex protein RSC6
MSLDNISLSLNDIIELLEKEIGRNNNLLDKSIYVKENIKFLRLICKKTKQIHTDVKKLSKKVNKKGNNHSGGFTIKLKITNELAEFLGLELGSLITRAETTKLIQKYIIDNNLQNPENKREIFPNKSLTSLLKYDKIIHGPMYYWTIQKLIQIHFIK